MTLDMHASLDEALAIVKSAGYRVSTPKLKSKPKRKDRAGPTIVVEFVDGVTTRMSVSTSLEQLDWERGMRLSQAAWQSRWRRRHAQHLKQMGRPCIVDLVAPVPPPVAAAHFERQDGTVLAHWPDSERVP